MIMASDDHEKVPQSIVEQIRMERAKIAKSQEIIRALEVVGRLKGELNGEDAPRGFLVMAKVVMKEAGHPLHTKVLAQRIGERFNAHVEAKTLTSMLYRNTVEQKKGVFVKVKDQKNTYWLADPTN